MIHGPKMVGFVLRFLPQRRFKGEDRWQLPNLDAGVADFVALVREYGLITESSCSGLFKDHKDRQDDPLNRARFSPFVLFKIRPGDSDKITKLAFFSFAGYWEYKDSDGVLHGQIFWPKNIASVAPPSHWTMRHPRPGPELDRIYCGYWKLAAIVLPLIFRPRSEKQIEKESVS